MAFDNTDNSREIRILVADDDQILSGRLVDFLTNNGFQARYARNGGELRNILLTWRPDFLLIDLFLPDANAVTTLRDLRQEGLLADDRIRVLIMSGHNYESNIKECLKAGASDFLVKPLKYIDVLQRLVLYKQKKRTLIDFESTEVTSRDAEYFMHLADLALQEALKDVAPEELLYNLTRMVAMAIKAVRVSVVGCDAEERIGLVVGSSDLRNLPKIRLDLNRYPEILYVLNSGKLLALDNLKNDPTMHFVTRQNKTISFNSMVVCPIRFHGEMYGVLSARMGENRSALNDFEIRFVQMVANVAANVLLRSHLIGAAGRRAA